MGGGGLITLMGPEKRGNNAVSNGQSHNSDTLIPVASDQLHSHWHYCDGPDFDSFAVIMSEFLRSRSLAVSEKNIDKL